MWKRLASVFAERDRQGIASNECIVEKILDKRWNKSIKRFEWKTKWLDGDVTWEPKESFVHSENEESVKNVHWVDFESTQPVAKNENLAGCKKKSSKLQPKRPTKRRLPLLCGQGRRKESCDSAADDNQGKAKLKPMEKKATTKIKRKEKKKSLEFKAIGPEKASSYNGKEEVIRTEFGNYSIREQQIMANPSAWLNDEIINTYFDLLSSKYDKDTLFFNSYFYPSLCKYLEKKSEDGTLKKYSVS